jgi:PASTA domain
MTSIFAITTTTATIPLNATGQGEVAFTITNNSGRSLQGQVKIRPQTPTDQSWLTLAQDTFLDFPKNATHNTTVQVKVPPGTAPGKYTFRIDVVSTAKPDEDFTEGPLVAFDVQSSKPPPKTFPWWILALAAVVLAVGGIFTWLIFFRSIAVPDVTGKRTELAIEKLDSQGFKHTQSQTESSDPAQAGTVTKQDPPANTQVARGSKVTLTVAITQSNPNAGKVQVPNVTGISWSDAQAPIKGSNLEANYKLQADGTPDGKIISQNPQPNTFVEPGSSVLLVLVGAYGPDTCLQGYVWREAFQGDHVCVTPETRAQAANDNAARHSSIGGDKCRERFFSGRLLVWRQASSDDHVCVTPETRTQTANDNSQAAARRVIP